MVRQEGERERDKGQRVSERNRERGREGEGEINNHTDRDKWDKTKERRGVVLGE